MLKQIIKKEIKENTKSLRFVFLILFCFTIISFSNYEMYKQHIRNVEDYSYKTTDSNEILIKKQPSILSVYVSGIQDLNERTFLFNKNMYEPMELSFGVDLNVFRQLFPTLDFVYIVNIILSLFALIMSFDLVCSEKNKGTLKLILSNSISKEKVIFGKFIANHFVLVFPVFVIFVLNIIIIGFIGQIDIKSDDYLRLFLILFFSFIYLAGFLAIGIMVSCLSKSSQNSFISCFIIWIFLIIIIPTVSALVSKNVSEIPNERMFEEKKQWIINQSDYDLDRADIETELRQLTYNYRNTLNSHIKTSIFLNRFSVSGAFSIFTTNVAGYGLEDELHFRESLTSFIHGINRSNDFNKQFFNYKRISLFAAINNSIIDIFILFCFPIFAFACAFFAFKKYDIR